MQNTVETTLLHYQDAVLGEVFNKQSIKHIEMLPHLIKINLELGFYLSHSQASFIQRLKNTLESACKKPVEISISTKIERHRARPDLEILPAIKNIIAVASGKGGVGKSTVAVNVALALAREGAKVGLLDADIYGPSQALMLGTKGKRPELHNGLLQPIIQHQIQTMSIAYLVDEHAPLVWRGPMIGKAMQQMTFETEWRDLDYLIIDLPPGTGDIQLTMCQKIPVSGAIIVTTPQDLSLLDVRRACEMFNKMQIPLLGVVENMSTYHCTHCGHDETLFGEGGANKIAEEYQTKVFAQIPLDTIIRTTTDHGVPIVLHSEKQIVAEIFHTVALKSAVQLAKQHKDYSVIFPKIVVEQTTQQGQQS